MYSTRILVLLALLIGFVNTFSWDIVVARNRGLDFFYNGTVTHREVIPSVYEIHSISYDPVHHRVLIVDYKNSIMFASSFDISSKKIQQLFSRDSNGSYNSRIVYDPATQLLFWKKNRSIHYFSYNSDKVGDENILLTLDHVCLDIAVDSCGGYIYWITDYEIERARLDGSEREVLIDSKVADRRSLAIDVQTQKIYWTEQKSGVVFVDSANFNGKNRTTLYKISSSFATSLTVSKDFLYWQQFYEKIIFQLPKNQPQQAARELLPFSSYCIYCRRIAAYYTIEEQIEGMNSCEALKDLIPNNTKLESTVSICQNYCFQGDCTVNAERQPVCSCKAGYSGKRCEVNACHGYCLNGGVCSLNEAGEPVCHCNADYDGQRCDVSICKDYCFQGNCSVGANGLPKCSCEAGYSGERCEVNVCYEHCLNGGICSLNEEDEPTCQCTVDYDGQRCEVTACKDNCSAEEESKVRCDAGNFGESGVNACHQYCLNGGVCSLDEKSEPVCQCPADYEGERCDVPAFLIKCFLYAYKNVPPATLSKAVESSCVSPPPVV